MTGGQRRCWEENSVSFIIKYELVVAHPSFVRSVHDCRPRVRLNLHVIWWSWCLKLGVVCKRLIVDWMVGYTVWKWSNVHNCVGPSTEPCGTPNMRRRRGSKIVKTNHTLTSIQKVWSKPLDSGRAETKDSFETGKEESGDQQYQTQLKDPVREKQILSSSVALSKSFTTCRSVVSVLCPVR